MSNVKGFQFGVESRSWKTHKETSFPTSLYNRLQDEIWTGNNHKTSHAEIQCLKNKACYALIVISQGLCCTNDPRISSEKEHPFHPRQSHFPRQRQNHTTKPINAIFSRKTRPFPSLPPKKRHHNTNGSTTQKHPYIDEQTHLQRDHWPVHVVPHTSE